MVCHDNNFISCQFKFNRTWQCFSVDFYTHPFNRRLIMVALIMAHSESQMSNKQNLRVVYFYVRWDYWIHLGECNYLDVLRTCLSWKVKTLDRIFSLEKSSILDFVKTGKNSYTYKFCLKSQIPSLVKRKLISIFLLAVGFD